MQKKLYIVLSAVAVLAVVIVGVVAQGRFFKGDFGSPLSGPCAVSAAVTPKPLSSPVSGTRRRDDDRRAPASAPNPCMRTRDEREMHKYIAPNVPVEKLQMNVKVRGK